MREEVEASIGTFERIISIMITLKYFSNGVLISLSKVEYGQWLRNLFFVSRQNG